MIEEEAREAGYNGGFNDGTTNGTEKMSRLILRLTETGRSEDIVKAAQDVEYREQLFKDFDL